MVAGSGEPNIPKLQMRAAALRSSVLVLNSAFYFLLVGLVVPALACGVSSQEQSLVVVKNALVAWKHEDWKKMYSFLSHRDRKKTTVNEFIEKRKKISIVERLVGYKILKARLSSKHEVFVSIELIILKSPQTQWQPSADWITEKVTTTWRLIYEKEDGWKITF